MTDVGVVKTALVVGNNTSIAPTGTHSLQVNKAAGGQKTCLEKRIAKSIQTEERYDKFQVISFLPSKTVDGVSWWYTAVDTDSIGNCE